MINVTAFELDRSEVSATISFLRFPLTVMIVMYHCYCVQVPINQPLYASLVYPFGLMLGETGVPAFFFISGFLYYLSQRCHGDWSMASPPTYQEVIDVTSTRPLSKDFDVKRFGLNTTSRIKAFVFRFVSIPAKRIRTSNANAIIHSSFFIYSIIWGKDSENLRTSQI